MPLRFGYNLGMTCFSELSDGFDPISGVKLAASSKVVGLIFLWNWLRGADG
jgi:hypothetical protein